MRLFMQVRNNEIETDPEREAAGGSEGQWRCPARSEQTQAKKVCLSCSQLQAISHTPRLGPGCCKGHGQHLDPPDT